MRRGTRFVAGAVSLLGTTLFGCSNPTPPGVALTDSEFQSAVLSVFDAAVIRAVADAPAGGASGVGIEAASVSSEVTEDLPCSFGGSVEAFTRIVGTVGDSDATADLDYLVELRHEDCVEGPSTGPDRVRLEGTPGIEAVFSYTRDAGGEVDVAGVMRGNLDVDGERADLSCAFDFQFVASGTEGAIEYTLSGSACGLPLQATIADDTV